MYSPLWYWVIFLKSRICGLVHLFFMELMLMILEGRKGFCVHIIKSTFGKLPNKRYVFKSIVSLFIIFSCGYDFQFLIFFRLGHSMTMRIAKERGGEESFLIPINNFTECKSLCTYWNKVGKKYNYLVESIKKILAHYFHRKLF